MESLASSTLSGMDFALEVRGSSPTLMAAVTQEVVVSASSGKPCGQFKSAGRKLYAPCTPGTAT